jgi:hypothetical protein
MWATCPRSPQLDESLTVRDNVMLGVADKKDKLDRFNELAMNYSDETADGDGAAAGQDRRPEPVGSRQPDRRRDGGAALPARRRDARKPVGRGTPPRRALQAAARKPRHAAAGRADQPPRRRDHRLAAAAPDRLQGHLPDRHARPLFPRRHHRLDPRTRPRPRHPLRGQLFVVAGAEGQAAGAGSARGQVQAEDAAARTGMDPRRRQGAAGQAEGPDQRL